MDAQLKQIKRKGKLSYTYSPLKNYRIVSPTDANNLSEGQVRYKGRLYSLIDGEYIIVNGKKLKIENGKIGNAKVIEYEEEKITKEQGVVSDLITDKLNFNINYPVDIEVQESYDGSVNLILNDNYNRPKMINSRFSPRSLSTYEIVDRIGVNDTNLYDNDTFELDTSLYKIWNDIPKILYEGLIYGGNLKVGNYVFYFRYADADGNETDFIGESSIVSVFIGNDSDPFSINGGFKNMNSNKGVQFKIKNIDQAYDYLVVYYTRSYADVLENRVTSAFRVEKKFTLHTKTANITIFGTEETTEVPLTDLNTQYFVASKAQTQAQCSNRLFLGGVSKPEIDYKEFTDISLRILPSQGNVDKTTTIGNVDPSSYLDSTGKYEYYNTHNVYSYVGYWPEEIYRFGVVYILNDNTHTPVFNIRGSCGIDLLEYHNYGTLWNDNGERNYILVNEETKLLVEGNQSKLENSKGVFKFDATNGDNIININFHINDECLNFLKNNLNVKGLFFVRQKRIPTILAQAFILPIDNLAHIPLILNKDEDTITYQYEKFFNDSGYLSDNYKERISKILVKSSILNGHLLAGICPEFEQNLSYYNQFFTGSQYIIKPISGSFSVSTTRNRIYNYLTPYDENDIFENAKIISVTENVPTVAIEEKIFQLNCGEAEDVSKFEWVESENYSAKDFSGVNIIRGIFGPYLGIVPNNKAYIYFGKIINIYISGYSINKMLNYFELRYLDDSTYYAISEIYSLDEILNYPLEETMYTLTCYRGDSYLCTYTHRLNRNFNDPSSPSNDKMVDDDTWKKNYDINDVESFSKMNRGDINAVKLGSWITFKLRSSTNLSIRSVDESYVSEAALMGSPRTFYPYSQLLAKGNNKMPESTVINDGFRSTVGERWYEHLPETPYYKNTFENRILYSEIAITDAFKNGYRVFYSTNFLDYKKEYGKIIKLVELGGNLLCVFEKAVGLLTVNERTALSDSNGGEVFINTRNVLPLEPRILSDTIGSLWKDSVIKTPYFVYGLDTRAKKIWRTNGSQLEIISDLKVNKFLVDNITLHETELSPIVGIKNVKTHYNANKQDIMFTFYDDTIDFKERAWNLCYNEILQTFVTFYSWIPSDSANIQNLFWSFDREVSKDIAMLGKTFETSTYSDGLIFELYSNRQEETYSVYKLHEIIGFVNKILPENPTLEITIEPDNYGVYKHFSFNGEKTVKIVYVDNKFNGTITLVNDYFVDENVSQQVANELYTNNQYIKYLNISVKVTYRDEKDYKDIIFTTYKLLTPVKLCDPPKQEILKSHAFWLHGRAGLYDVEEPIKPTKWYGKLHPFEFECIVNDSVYTLKIFTNLQLISNKVEPESFHFEVVGENYEWAADKKNIYYRQEALKELACRYGYSINFDPKYTTIKPEYNPSISFNVDSYYQSVYGHSYNDNNLHKSILFPQYYLRVREINKLYDLYIQLEFPNKQQGNYNGLTGTEIIYNEDRNEFSVWTHVLNLPITKYGVRKGNSSYIEDEWRVQIPSIYFKLKDESHWNLPPIVISDFVKTFSYDLKEFNIPWDSHVLPKQYEKIYDNNSDKSAILRKLLDTSTWSVLKETKIRDKYIRIRVRYSGEDLAIISGLITLYNESYG